MMTVRSDEFVSLVTILQKWAEQRPDKVAYTLLPHGELKDTEHLSYSELDRRASRLAAVLRSQTEVGDRVLLLYRTSLDFVIAFMSCLYGGVVAVPAYPPDSRRTAPRLQAIVANADPKVVLTSSAVASKLRAIETELPALRGLSWLVSDKPMTNPGGSWEIPALDPKTLAFLQYTSGSTADPKGVMISHGNLVHNQRLIKESINSSERSVFVSWLPLFHDMGLIGNVLQSLDLGALSVLMAPSAFLRRPRRWLEAISSCRATVSGGPNFAYRLCREKIRPAERRTLDLRRWRVAFNGAEPIYAQTLEEFARDFEPCGFQPQAYYPCYGLAEATLQVTGGLVDSPPVIANFEATALERGEAVGVSEGGHSVRRLVSCGGTWLQQRVVIVDPVSHLPCPAARVGEIWVAGESVGQGYWQQPEASRAFEATLAEPLADGFRGPFLRTGDLGFLRAGELFVTGRRKDLMILRGRNLYPQDIERTVQRTHPALRSGSGAAFSVVEDSEEQLVVVQGARQAGLDVTAVADAVRQAVSEEHQVTLYALVLVAPGDIPKTSSGKIQRRVCRQHFLEGKFEAAPKSILETVMEAAGGGDVSKGRSLRLRLVEAPASERARMLSDHLEGMIRRVLRQPPAAERLDPHQPMTRLGIDSLGAVNLAESLSDLTGREVPVSLPFDHPTIASLTRYLLEEVFEFEPLPESPGGKRLAEVSTRPETEPIAVIGIGCRFPGGVEDPEGFWQLLHQGIDAVHEVPSERWELEEFYDPDPDAPGKMYTRWGGFLSEPVDLFDARFFDLTPSEAAHLDPQHRLLLEVCWQALEHAGQSPTELEGSATGVFLGLGHSDYSRLLSRDLNRLNSYGALGFSPSMAAGRISYLLGLKGPSLAVDTACSSSLVALHQACQSLKLKECDMALVGGINLTLTPELSVYSCKIRALSTVGRCQSFAAGADGYVRGEGGGIVVLKRLSEAQAAGDHVLAVVCGSAVNQDGRSSSLTAPSGPSQQAVIRQALQQAGIEPAAVDYVETHGSGTALGDPIEAKALGEVMRQGRSPEEPLAIGSVKTNIGHLEAASGVAGLMKTVLALSSNYLPKSLHFTAPSPYIPFDQLALSVQDQGAPWPDRGPAYAGVSSFGLAGTNAHVVLGQGPPSEPSGPSRHWLQLRLSARTASALESATARLVRWLRTHPDHNLADVAFSLQVGRKSFEQRRFVMCSTSEEAIAALESVDPGKVFDSTLAPGERPVAFLFPGVGDHYLGMGEELYRTEPVFRQVFDHCATVLEPLCGVDLREVLFPRDGATAVPPDPRTFFGRAPAPFDDGLHRASLAQPTIFVVEVALARLLISWGVRPQVMIGYSLGEFTAACLAGVLSLDDALRVVAERARRIDELPEGAMCAVSTSEERVRAMLGDELSLAAFNGPELCVVSGSVAAVESLEQRLAAADVTSRRLRSSHAIHSSMMQPLVKPLTELLESVELQAPDIPYLSNVTGTWVTPEEATDPAFWARHLCSPVQFAAGLAKLLEDPGRVLLEVGPGQSLGFFARQMSDPAAHRVILPSLPYAYDEQPADLFLQTTLGKLWLAGAEIDDASLFADQRRQRIPLPTYPFERQPYWIDSPEVEEVPVADSVSLGKRSDPADWFYLPGWRRHELPPSIATVRGERWLLFLDEGGLGLRLAAHLEREGRQVIGVRVGGKFEVLNENTYALAPGAPQDYVALLDALAGRRFRPSHVVHFWAIYPSTQARGTEAFSSELQERGFYSLLFLAQALGRAEDEVLDLTVVSSGLGARPDGTAPEPTLAMILAPVKVIPQELPQINCRSIDVALAKQEEEEEEVVRRLLAEIAADSRDRIIALRSEGRWVEAMKPFRLAAASKEGVVRPGAVILITGGLSGVGLVLAEHFARIAGARLALLSRSPFPPREAWSQWVEEHGAEDSVSQRIGKLEAFEELGAEVLVLSADVADEEQMQGALEQLDTRFAALHGVIHAAEDLTPEGLRPLHSFDVSGCEVHFRSKVFGLMTLERLLAARQLDFFLLMSSISSQLGGPGLVAYTAAHLFMDSFAAWRRHHRGGPFLSVNWDLWDLGEPAIAGSELGRFAMTAVEGAEAVSRVLASELPPQVVQSTGELEARLDRWVRSRPSRPVVKTEQPKTSANVPLAETERLIAEIWKQVLGIDEVGIHDNFFDLGGNSLLGMHIISRLNRTFDTDLSVRSLFDAPTIEKLGDEVGRGTGLKVPPLAPVHPKPAELPLSFLQERHWLIDELTGYQDHTSSLFEIKGALSLTALRTSFGRLIERQEALRFIFRQVEDQPVQVVSPHVPLSLPFSVIDLSRVCDSIFSHPAKDLLLGEARRAMDLGHPPLFRMTLLRMGPERHVLLFTAHHIIFDGWSWVVLYDELAELYSAQQEGREASLKPLRFQYSDFVLWQRQWLQGTLLETELAYWKRKFHGVTQVLERLADHPHAKRRRPGHKVPFRLSEELSEALRRLSREQGVTLLMTTLALFKVLLFQTTGLLDISLATLGTGRNRVETENLLGYFAAMIGLRTVLDRHASFVETLGQVRLQTLDAFERQQDLPFQKLVSEFKPEIDLSHVMDVTFNFFIADDPRLQLTFPGLDVSSVQYDRGGDEALSLQVEEGPKEISGFFLCSAGIFQPRTADRLARGYEDLAVAATEQPEACLTDLVQATIERDERRWRQRTEGLREATRNRLRVRKRKGVKI